MWWQYYSIIYDMYHGWYIFDVEAGDYVNEDPSSSAEMAIKRANQLLEIKIEKILLTNE